MIALFTLIGLAIVLIVIIALCAAGTIGVNAGIGIRIPATRLSAQAWRAGHGAALLPAVIGGTVIIAVAGVGLAVAGLAQVMQILGVLLLLATLAWASVRAASAARAAAGD